MFGPKRCSGNTGQCQSIAVFRLRWREAGSRERHRAHVCGTCKTEIEKATLTRDVKVINLAVSS